MNTVERLEKLAKRATRRPWAVQEGCDHGGIKRPDVHYVEGVLAESLKGKPWVVRFDDDYGTDQGSDASLIVAAVNALPDLLAAAKALREIRAVEKQCDETRGWPGHNQSIARRELAKRAVDRALEPLFREEPS